MKVYLSEDKSDFVEVLALYAKICSRNHSESEKRLGLQFLDITSNGMQYYYFVNRDTAFKHGVTTRYLKRMCDELLDSTNEKINLVDFRRDRNGNIYLKPVQLKNTFTKNGRASRRYILVNYKGRVVLTDVSRLNNVTKHYKKNRERNEKGLQWENYINILKSGGPFNMSYS